MKTLALLAAMAGISLGQSFPTSIATDATLMVARNTAQTTLAAPIGSSDTSVILTSGATFGNNMAVSIGTEHMFCATLTTNTLSGCTRGFDGSTAASHSSGTAVFGYLIAKHHNGLKDEIKAIETALGVNLANVSVGSVDAVAIKSGSYFVTSGTGTAYTGSPATAPASLATGMRFVVVFNTVSTTTTPTLNINSQGTKTLVHDDSTALASGEVGTSGYCVAYYDGTNIQLTGSCLTGPGKVKISDGAGGALTIVAPSTGGGTVTGPQGNTTLSKFRTACIVIGADNASSALADADLGPQHRQYQTDVPMTLLQLTVSADAGTPNVIVGRSHAGTITNVTSSALATGSSGAIACSNAGGTTGIDSATTCASTLQNTAFAAGDWVTLVSGTAGGTAKEMTICPTWTIN